MPLIVTNPAQQPIDSAGEIPSGTVFPTSPATGDLFLFTPFSSVYEYNGSAWINLWSLASFTMYVDATLGTDSNGKGTGTGANAFLTYPYALSHLPRNYGGDITIKLAAGSTYRLPQTIPAAQTNGYFTYTDGDITEQLSGTTSGYFRDQVVAGGGQVQTTGSSTTVDLIAGGATTNLCVGAVVTANSLKRIVTAINSATQFTVDTAVDWSVGYAWTYNNFGTWVDVGAGWADDQYNNMLFHFTAVGVASPFSWTPSSSIALFPIKDTFASGERLQLGAGLGNYGSGLGSYKIYSLNTTIAYTLSSINIFLTGMIFRCLKIDRSNATGITWQNVSVYFLGCDIIENRSLVFNSCFAYFSSCWIRRSLSGFTILTFSGYSAAPRVLSGTGNYDAIIEYCYFSPLSGVFSAIAVDRANIRITYCLFEWTGGSTYPISATVHASVTFGSTSGTCIARYISGFSTAAARAQFSSFLANITTANFGLQNVGFAAQSSVDAAQMSYAT